MPPAMTAERCANRILAGVAANRGVIPITTEAWAAWWLNRISPALAANVSGRVAGLARWLAASSVH